MKKNKIQLKDLIAGDEFIVEEPLYGSTEFIFQGRADVFIFGPNAYDISPKNKDNEIYSIENRFVHKME